MTSTEPERSPGNTPAVTRAIRILDLLAERAARLARSPRSPVNSAWPSPRCPICVSRWRRAAWSAERRRVSPGRRTVELGSAFLSGFDQIREFYRTCEDSDVLRRQLVQIAMLDGARVLYLAVHEGRERFPLSASVGDRYPASATAVGTVLLVRAEPGTGRRTVLGPAGVRGLHRTVHHHHRPAAGQTGRTREQGYAAGRGRGALLRPRGWRCWCPAAGPASRPSGSASRSCTPPVPRTNATPFSTPFARPRDS